jgi:hypothetical protein
MGVGGYHHEAGAIVAAATPVRAMPHGGYSSQAGTRVAHQARGCGPQNEFPAGDAYCVTGTGYCRGPNVTYAYGAAVCPTDPGCDLACKRQLADEFNVPWYNFGFCEHVYPGSGCPPNHAGFLRGKESWDRQYPGVPLGQLGPTELVPSPTDPASLQHLTCIVSGIAVACPPICQPPNCLVYLVH